MSVQQQSRPVSVQSPAVPRPQPRPAPPRRSKAWIGWIIALLIVGGGIWALVHFRKTSEQGGQGRGRNKDAPIPVVTATVQTKDFPTYLDALGTVTALNTVTVRSRVDGQIDTVAYKEGQMVHEGDLLVQIDPRPFQVQLDTAKAQLAKDQAALKNAQVELDRYKAAEEAIPQQQIDTQQATVDQDAAAVKIDESSIENAQLQLTYARITAPLTGRIGLRTVDQGNIVHASDSTGIATITQIQPIAVVFSVSRDDLTPVLEQQGRGVGLQVEAYNRDFTHRFGDGKVTAVDNQVDITTGTIRLKAEFPNETSMLFPQQFVNARLLVKTLPKALTIPLAAVQRGPDNLYVYVVKNEAVEVRPIKQGPTEGDDTVITDGLSEGEMVVTDGLDKLNDKSKVIVREPGKKGAASQPATQQSTGQGHHRNHAEGQ